MDHVGSLSAPELYNISLYYSENIKICLRYRFFYLILSHQGDHNVVVFVV